MDGEYLASYVPDLVRRHLAHDPSCTSRELGLDQAAVLLTDMEGFTGRVERVASGGRPALERFNAEIDRYFACLIEAVHAEGGDILAFAGDSLLCVWPAPAGAGLDRAIACAARAGQRIQRTLSPAHPTRVGIGAGTLHGVLAGGQDGRWELLAAGPALSAAIEAERQGRPGQVVVHPSAWPLLPLEAHTVAEPSGARLLVDLPSPATQAPAAQEAGPAPPIVGLAPLVPAAVLHRVQAGQTDWLAEVRPVTVVVVGLHGLDWPAPDALEIAHRSVRQFQILLERFGGTPRLSLDDKGLLVTGDFGLPPSAPDRHAERAVRAAQEMLALLRDLGVECGIGVATDRALCMGFGNAQRRGYGVFGDGTNVATRLMQTARNEVLCDDATAQAARERLQFSAPQDLEVKGRQQPVRVCRPAGWRQAAADPPLRMVGRTPEREHLQRRVEALQAGRHGGLLLLEGEAGLGKSMLLGEAQRQAQERGLRCLTGHADVVDRSTPYLAWRPVFADLLELPEDLDGSQAAAHILSRFSAARAIAGLLPLMGPVLGLSIPDSAQTRDLQGEVRAANTHRVMRAVLGHLAARQRLLIALEDAHWLDSASLAFLGWLARRADDWLVIITLRPDFDRQPWPRALRTAAAERLRLRELSAQEIHELARVTLGVAQLPRALEQVLSQKVSGNPFFCCELLRALQDSGRLRVREGLCETQGLLDDLPATVESTVLGRLDRLAPSEQLCLKTAAILGQSFHQDALCAIHPVAAERTSIDRHLATARSSGLVRREGPAPDAAWSFRHAIVRDVAYALWTREQRAPLHRAIAGWYEARFADDLPPWFSLLAHHWDEAGAAAPALHYLELAGAQSLRTGAFAEARRLHGRALALAGEAALDAPPERRARWHSGLGMALYYLGELAESRQHLEIAAGLLDRPVPGDLATARRGLLGNLLRQIWHLLRPGPVAGRLARRQAQIDLAAECYTKLGQIYYLDGEPAERLIGVTLAGLNLAEQGGLSAALARVLAGSSILASIAGLGGLAEAYARRAQAVATAEAGREAAPHVWHYHAILYAQQGRWPEARQANDRALALIRDLGDQTLEAEACVVRSTFLLCQDDFAGAEAAWSRALRLSRRVGNPQIECWSLLDAAETHLGRLDLAAAERTLAEALQIPTQAQDGYSAIEKQRMLARLRLAQHRPDEAHAACRVVYAMVHAQPPAGYHWADFYATTVEVVLDLIETEPAFARHRHRELRRDARTGCRRLRMLARRFGNVGIRARILCGRLDWIEGRRARAIRCWRDAVALSLAEDRPNEAARALILLRRAGDDAGAQTLPRVLPALQARESIALLQALSGAPVTGLAAASPAPP